MFMFLFILLHISCVMSLENHIIAQQQAINSCYNGTYIVSKPPYSICSGFRTCSIGSYCIDGIMKPCPEGTFGNTMGLYSELCSGSCPGGYYCPRNTIVPIDCGSESLYCPIGSVKPTTVPQGHYSIGSESSALDTTTLHQHDIRICERGHYCIDGHKEPCRGGTYGLSEGLMNANCTGVCPVGFYCPLGSIYPTARPCNPNNPNEFCPAGSDHAISTFRGYYAINNTMIEGSGNGAGGGYSSQVICPMGSYCIDGLRFLCPAGRFGNIVGSVNASCSDACLVGFYCPPGSISKIQIPCGSNHQYCPESSDSPIPVSIGHYTVTLSQISNIADVNFNYTSEPDYDGWNYWDNTDHNYQIIERAESNSLGAYAKQYYYNSMRKGNQSLCEPGYYCLSDGIRRLCPKGRYGATEGLSSAWCTDTCPAGYYCPEGSSDPIAHPCGNHSVYCPVGSDSPFRVSVGWYSAGGLTANTSTTERKCEPGTYCSGDGVIRLCSAGRYGSSFGLSDANCSGACSPGYYCPEGSTTSLQVMCGDPSLYCPVVKTFPYGNRIPVPVLPGYYSIGNGGLDGDGASGVVTRTSQTIAPRGYYATKGLKYICPAGKYGATTGLTTPDCSGVCDVDGYYCPAGSVSPYQKACGSPNVICPAGIVIPLQVRPGYYTSDPSLELCSPGMWRDWTGESVDNSVFSLVPTHNSIPNCQLCPANTYKRVSGDSISLCIPCNSTTQSVRSSGNRVTCDCTTIVEDGYTSIYDSITGECNIIANTTRFMDESYYEYNSTYTRFEEFECDPGYYCVNGLRFMCDAGYYNSRTRLQGIASTSVGNIVITTTSDSGTCEGKCGAGYYCPAGSTSPYAVPCGGVEMYCPEGSPTPILVSPGYFTNEGVSELYRSEQFPCPPGYYCKNAQKFLCPGGTYSDQYRTTSETCMGECDPGYYCAPGSSNKRQFECGSAAVICPRGSSNPLPVLNGFYSVHTGDDENAQLFWDSENVTQSAQIPCEPGYYCTEGRKYPCPPGTFGWRFGLNSSLCSGLCAPGYYCPSYLEPTAGVPKHTIFPLAPHTKAAEYECGGSEFVCTKGSFFPKRVGGGNYSTGGDENNQTRTGQEVCEKGSYCVDGIIQPCPKGKYGNTSGLAVISCNGWCPPAHQCPLGTKDPIVCEGQTYAVGAQWDCAPCPGSGNETFTLSCHNSRYCCFQGG